MTVPFAFSKVAETDPVKQVLFGVLSSFVVSQIRKQSSVSQNEMFSTSLAHSAETQDIFLQCR